MAKKDIGWAVYELIYGGHVTRKGWNGKGQYLRYVPAEGSMLPYIVIMTVSGYCVPWHASQTDLLADDWELADH